MKQLKENLGSEYVFKRILSQKDVRRLLNKKAKQNESQVVLYLIAGCMKIEICLYSLKEKWELGYDIFVKDVPEAKEWIYYDSPNEPVSFCEEKVFSVLDQAVRENGLSYTECCFEKLDGEVKVKKDEMGIHKEA